MADHDTAAIRRLARNIESTVSTLSNTNQNVSRQIWSINNDMCGDTAAAINDTTERLNAELKSIQNGLAKCADFLYHYAHELDVADEMSGKLINSK